MFADSHAHYYGEQFQDDLDALLCSMPQNDVSLIINVGGDIKTSEAAIKTAKKYDFIYAAAGFHPHDTKGLTDGDIEKLKVLLNEDKVVAVGEIGLDYYYDNSPRDEQRHWFLEQLILAGELGLPFIVHDRDAHKDTIDIIKSSGALAKTTGVLHCFSGSPEMAGEVVGMGMYLSVGGPVTFQNAVKVIEVIKQIPLDRLLIETDCPYLSPVPNRGKRNDSTNLKYIAQKIAEIRETDIATIASITMENTKRLFGI